MQNYLCCIYIATNTINNKSYIGYTSNFNSRRRTHKSAAIKNTYNSYFHKAIRKYGWENFKWEIIYQSNDIDFTKNIMEGYLISKLETIKHGYNISKGGDGSPGVTPWNKGMPCSKEQKEKLRISNIGVSRTIETKQKMSLAKKGNKNSFYGKKHSETSKEKISQANKGKHWWGPERLHPMTRKKLKQTAGI